MAAEEVNVAHVQVKFFTKQEQYSVPDYPFSVPSDVSGQKLSDLINSLLTPDGDDDHKSISFDFLIDGEFLRTNLNEYIIQKEISTETVLEIEYLEQQAAPTPEDSLLHDDWVSCLHGLDKFIISGCYDNTIKIWNTDGANLVTIPGHNNPVKCIRWISLTDEQGLFISGSHDQTLLMWEWNAESNAVECRHIYKGHAGSVDCVAVDSTKTRVCSGSWDKMLKIWSAAPERRDSADEDTSQQKKKKKTNSHKVPTRVPLMTLSGHKEAISSVAWVDLNEVCTASWDHTIKFWDLTQGVEKSSLAGNKTFLDLSYSPLTKTIVAASADRHVRLYDPRITDGALVQSTFTHHTGWVSTVNWSPTDENLFISGSYDMVLKLWDTRSPKAPLYNMSGHEDRILASDWTIPNLMMSGGADNNLKIFRYDGKS